MGAIVTGFGFASTAADVAEGADLGGRRAVVTGGASPLGTETARELARAGAAVTLAVRDLSAGQRAAAGITAATGNPDVTAVRLDLADQGSVAAFAAAWDGPLHLLVNGADLTRPAEQRMARRWESRFAVNHLGHFALASGLHRALAAARGARIVAVSSSTHLYSPVVFDDIHFAFRPHDPLLAYGQSKTANVLFAVGATARWSRDGIYANALMPGGIATALQRHQPPEYIEQAKKVMRLKTPEQGAATSVLLAAHPSLEGIGGRYYEDCAQAPVIEDGLEVPKHGDRPIGRAEDSIDEIRTRQTQSRAREGSAAEWPPLRCRSDRRSRCGPP